MNEITYKPGDIVRFRSCQPHQHLMEMFPYGFEPDDIKNVDTEVYVGRIDSIIDDQYMIFKTIEPLDGFICINTIEDVIEKIDADPMPEEWQHKLAKPELVNRTMPNVYILSDVASLQADDAQVACYKAVVDALRAQSPDKAIRSIDIRLNWYSQSTLADDVEELIETYKVDKAERQNIESLKFDLLENIKYSHFRCHHAAMVDFQDGDWWLLAIDHEFQYVSIMRDAGERAAFSRSLGPSYGEVHNYMTYLYEQLTKK